MVEKIILCGEDFEQDIRPLIQSFSKNTVPEIIRSDSIDYDIAPAVFAADIQPQHIYLAYNNGNKIFRADEHIESHDHRALRNQLMRAVYRILSGADGIEIPWGILTGIRPTKLILEQLEADTPEDNIYEAMRKIYYCSDEKIALGIQIAKKELELLRQVPIRDTYSIYVGIPFCPSICNYCSFSSYPLEKYGHMETAYVQALAREIEQTAELFKGKKPCTVYFGGGTPTTLQTENLRYLIKHIKACFPMDMVREFTVEAGRADTITEEKLEMLKAEGVTRISINPQSMREHTLQLIGRRHTPEQVERAFELARKTGHNNINMDIILGLSGETPRDVEYTLSKINELQPEGLTVHTLARKRAAKLTTESQNYKGTEAVDVKGMFELSREYTKNNGYIPYYLYRQKYMSENLENIGYAKPGYECLYNVLIMEEKQIILALGAGASSKFVFYGENRFERVENVKNIPDYISRIDEMILRKKNFLQEHRIL